MELLVVVGIVAVLLALLLPALAGVREQARRAKCASNLHTMGQALTMYVQQSGCYPCWRLNDDSIPGLNFAIWPAQLGLYMNGNREVFFCPSQDERCAWWPTGGALPPGHFGGRAGEYQANFGYAINEPLLQVDPGCYFSYGYNMGGVQPGYYFMNRGLGQAILRYAPNEPGTGGLRASRVKVASAMIAIADATADGKWDTAICPLAAPNWMNPGRVHKGGANVVFCDGHVQWYPQADLVLSPAFTSPDDLKKRRMWNCDNEP